MAQLTKRFISVAEDTPGQQWLDYYNSSIDAYRKWFLKEGEIKRPKLQECEAALKNYMPELYPMWEQLLNLTNADDLDARLLSFYCPAPYVAGCSQAVWNRGSPILVRNYDYSPELSEGRICKTKWHNTSVIASTDCLWGVLDGMNEHGLVVSLSFGGREEVREGFGIPIILRYILEFCTNVAEAVEVLQRIPTHMAYNITLLDGLGNICTVELSPFASPVVSIKPFAVNHQGDYELSSYAIFSRSFERKQALVNALYQSLNSVESFITAFEYAPLFVSNYEQDFGTLYTAVYNPTLLAMEFRWPLQVRMYQSFESFHEQEIWVNY